VKRKLEGTDDVRSDVDPRLRAVRALAPPGPRCSFQQRAGKMATLTQIKCGVALGRAIVSSEETVPTVQNGLVNAVS